MRINQIARVLGIYLIVLFTSGCGKCEPVVKYIKPNKVEIPEARVEQCRFKDQVENIKCVLGNYLEVKQERDSLRSAIDELTE